MLEMAKKMFSGEKINLTEKRAVTDERLQQVPRLNVPYAHVPLVAAGRAQTHALPRAHACASLR